MWASSSGTPAARKRADTNSVRQGGARAGTAILRVRGWRIRSYAATRHLQSVAHDDRIGVRAHGGVSLSSREGVSQMAYRVGTETNGERTVYTLHDDET